MLKNALRRTPGSGTSFICLFCKPSNSTTVPLRLSPLRGSTTPAALRTLTTTPQCLKNSTGKRKSKVKAQAKAKAAAAAAAAAAGATPATEESALDEMRKGIDAIVAKQLATEQTAAAKKKKKAKKGDGRKSVVGEDGKRRPLARMVAGVRKKEGMTLAEAMAKSGARRKSVSEEKAEAEAEVEEMAPPRPRGLEVIDPDMALLERE